MEETTHLKPKRTLPHKKKLFAMLLGAVILSLIASSTWSYYNYRQIKQEVLRLSSVEGQQELAQKEVDDLLGNLSKLIILPDGEDPTVATVTDVEALKENQPFFEKAENGDKLVVYTNAKKAIIYSPTRNVIVNVGALLIDQGSPEVAGTSIDQDDAQQEQLEAEE